MNYGKVFLILVIVILVIGLSNLRTDGVNLIGNACIAGPGYLCQSLSLSQKSGALTASIGQSTGTNWGNSIIIFASKGSSMSSNEFPIVYTSGNYFVMGELASGGTKTVVFTTAIPGSSASGPLASGPLASGGNGTVIFTTAITASSTIIGATLNGQLWACYTKRRGAITYITGPAGGCVGNGTVYYTQIAELKVQAT